VLTPPLSTSHDGPLCEFPDFAQRPVSTSASAGGVPVVDDARGGDVFAVPLRPAEQAAQRLVQLLRHRRGFVLHARRDRRVDRALQQAVALEVAQRQRQHPAADPFDRTLQLGEPHRPPRGLQQDADRPLAADPVDDLQHRADIEFLRVDLGDLDRYIDVPLGHESASFPAHP
jgi:hypothetical protein